MALFLDILFNLILPYQKQVTEDEITTNMRLLKQNDWFNALLFIPSYQQFIIHDREIRKTIGNFSTSKLRQQPNHPRFKRKLLAALKRKQIIISA
ncbi:MAG TPA: hypothetical protein VK067_05445 [Pseudogracilibacillus sp.]|nr:hypothetical protein [Pseudogracilibacillus sp.]